MIFYSPNKTKKVVGTSGSDTSLQYPPGFTPDKSTNVINEKEVSDAAEVRSNSKSDEGLGSKAKKDGLGRVDHQNIKLEFTLSIQETKMELISAMDVKQLWGNYIFDHSFSEALGNSGVYAPQSLSSKQMLWSYISSLIVRWNGECLVMGDFNESLDDKQRNDFGFKKKLQLLKKKIRGWVMDYKRQQVGRVNDLKAKLSVIDKELDQGIMVDGEWMDDPSHVKEEFHNHFATRFQDPGANRGNINI
ncbi:hypothetical protein Tco_0715275 [Tanacetum coccineum]